MIYKEEAIQNNSAVTCDKNMELIMSEILSRYGNILLRMSFIYLKDIHLAEDAVQDTFVKIYQNYGKFNGDSDEKTWITRIAINTCKNYLRNPWRKRIDESVLLESIPAENYETEIQHGEIIAEIMKLSNKYKEVILLYYYQEMKIREIAKALKIPEATVSTRLNRAKNILKNKLGGFYYNE